MATLPYPTRVSEFSVDSSPQNYSNSNSNSNSNNNQLTPHYGHSQQQHSAYSNYHTDLFSSTPTGHASASSNDIPDDVLRAQEEALALLKNNNNDSSSISNRARSVTPPRSMLARRPNNRTSSGRSLSVPRSRNPTGSDAVHPDKDLMKRERKAKTAVGAASGVVVGTLVAGPVGFVLGGPIGGYAANKISKNGERRAQRKHEQQSFQRAAGKSAAANCGSFV